MNFFAFPRFPFLFSGQLISDDVAEIFSRQTSDFIVQLGNTLSTKSASAQYDDSYLGNPSHTPTHTFEAPLFKLTSENTVDILDNKTI